MNLQRFKPTPEMLQAWLFEHAMKGGASTVTYGFPVAGTTAPSAAQAATQTHITATVQFGDTDTIATVTHNWGLSTTQNSAFFPEVDMQLNSSPTTAIPFILATLGTNSVNITKASATGSAGTLIVHVRRPAAFEAYTN